MEFLQTLCLLFCRAHFCYGACLFRSLHTPILSPGFRVRPAGVCREGQGGARLFCAGRIILFPMNPALTPSGLCNVWRNNNTK